MVVLYRGPTAHITDNRFESRSPRHQVFTVRKLHHVHVLISQPGPLSPVGVGSTGLAGVAAIGVLVGGPTLDAPPVTLVALAVLAVSAVVSGACVRVRERPHELWAFYDGQLVCLYRTGDAQTFGQVRRALVRAFEYHSD